MNDLVDLIDVIEEQCQQSELEVMIALTDVYVKSAIMMEMGYIEEPEDAEVYQEGRTIRKIRRELNAPSKGWSDESPIKRILMFLPRLIKKIIDVVLFIIGIAIGIVVGIIASPAIYISEKIKNKKYERDSKEMIEIDFNLPFVYEVFQEFSKFIQGTKYLGDELEISRTKKNEKPALLQAVLLSTNYITEMKEYINKFETQAYKKVTISVADANACIEGLKAQDKVYKLLKRAFGKDLTGMIDDANLTQEEQKTIREFANLCSDYVKKTNEFKQKLESQMNKLETEKKKKEKGTPGRKLSFDEYLNIIKRKVHVKIQETSSNGAETTISIPSDDNKHVEAIIKLYKKKADSSKWNYNAISILTPIGDFSNNDETQNKLKEIASKPLTFKVMD